jgi:hypothetical protein
MKIAEIIEGFYWSQPFKISSDEPTSGGKLLNRTRRLKPHLLNTEIPLSRNRRRRPNPILQTVRQTPVVGNVRMPHGVKKNVC